jgi:hypothetical protein
MLALGLTAIVLIGVPWTLKLVTAPKLGQPCGGGFDCQALDGRCIEGEHGRFCTVACEADSDCPSSGYCGIPPHDRWQRWFSTSVVSERFCVPGPRPEQPIDIDPALPGSGEPGVQFRPPEQRGGLGGSKLRASDQPASSSASSSR